jgi:aurora kinase
VCGTLDYLSPEVAVVMLRPGKSKEFYTKAIDQWSLGVLMYELLVGRAPFEMKNDVATQKKIAGYKGKGIKFPAYISESAKALIGELLNMDAEERLGFGGVVEHPWIVRHTERSRKSGVRMLGMILEQATGLMMD